MLGRMESAYLGLLRVVILVAATLALVAAAILLVTAIPSVLTRVGVLQSQDQAHTLSEFISEQKPVEEGGEASPQAPEMIDPTIAKAAANFHSYLGARATTSRKEWEQGLQSAQNEMPAPVMQDYGESVLTLSEELLASKGKPLGEKRVFQLVEWHRQRFAASYEQRMAEKEAADAAFRFQVGAAFGAFMLFVLITFIFLFVRIERNLRVIKVEQTLYDA